MHGECGDDEGGECNACVSKKPHQKLDKEVDPCCRPQPFLTETKQIGYLFELYGKYIADLFAKEKKGKKEK